MRVLNLDLFIIKITLRVPFRISSETWVEIEAREEKLMNEMYEFFTKLRKTSKGTSTSKKTIKKKSASKPTLKKGSVKK